ncbi:MAG: hypothetical protein ABR536_05240, partial [Solirubrobacterales bacterium]
TQSRLLDVMDNHDGTLSIFGTMINHEGPVKAPTSVSPTSSPDDLASLARTIAFNDFQEGGTNGRDGQPEDRNVELLIDDPRDNIPPPGSGSGVTPGAGSAFTGHSDGACANTIRGTRRADELIGGRGGDRILGRRGGDRIRGMANDDCIKGQGGKDRIKGGPGADILKGGRASDLIKGHDGEVDRINCGRGKRDRVVADSVDVIARNCEKVRRR